MEKQFRFDAGEVQRATITEEGFLRAVCVMTRTGVFTYVNQDGSLRRELRLPEEVFKAESMNTLKMVPVTNEHPPEKIVNADNSKQLSVGNTGESVSVNAPFLLNSILVTDQNAVEDVKSGKVQLSCGYSLDLEEKPGEYMGERYDVIQRNIVYNHVAIVGNGKAGRQARIALDANEAVQVDSDEGNDILVSFTEETGEAKIWADEGKFKGVPHTHKYKVNSIGNGETDSAGEPSHVHEVFAFTASWADGHYHELTNVPKVRNDSKPKTPNKENNPMLPKINLDGIEYEASQEVINAFNREKTRADNAETAVKTLTEEKATLQANCDSQAAEIKKLEAAASDDAAVQKRVDARIALVTLGQTHLDKEETANISEMSDAEIKTAIIKKANPEVNTDTEEFKNEVYANAYFDSAVSILKKQANADKEETSDSGMGNQRRQANADKFEKGKKDQNADAAEKSYQDGLTSRWKRN